jgi:DNA repair photolyase
LRDIDILQELSRWRLVRVFISITSLNADLAKLMEPRAATPLKRLQVVETLSSAGVPVGVMTAPIIPFLNDLEIESILKKVSELGAYTSGYVFIRLPFEVKNLFEEWLDKHFPLKKNHILNLIRNSRNGKLYDAQFGKRMTGEGSYAELLAKRYSLAKKKFNLNRRMPDYDFSLFQPPYLPSNEPSLFDIS